MTTPEYGSLRSDDDHWDIVSNVGYTALLVAGWRALHTTGPNRWSKTNTRSISSPLRPTRIWRVC